MRIVTLSVFEAVFHNERTLATYSIHAHFAALNGQPLPCEFLPLWVSDQWCTETPEGRRRGRVALSLAEDQIKFWTGGQAVTRADLQRLTEDPARLHALHDHLVEKGIVDQVEALNRKD